MKPAAFTALALLAGISLPATTANAGDTGLHLDRTASAAIADTDAAIRAITAASELTVNDATPYHTAAREALQLIDGGASAEQPGGGQATASPGALGYLSQLLHRAGNQPWKPAIQAAWVNETVASRELQDATVATKLSAFRYKMTDALESLDVALGRSSALGALGGLEGAVATTDLGVPGGAATVSGCQLPSTAPVYGVTSGYLMYVALSGGNGQNALPHVLGVRQVARHDGNVVLYTAADRLRPTLCHQSDPASGDPPNQAAHASKASSVPKLYTEAQAQQGASVFQTNCAMCHGPHMQGKNTAPAIAGTAFLKKAKLLGWSVDNMRTLIVTSMPANNPGSLSKQQYAKVIAFLLASDCYPAGKTPFPTEPTTKIKQAPLKAPTGATPTNKQRGTCALSQSTAAK